MKLTGYPKFVPEQRYQQAISEMADRLSRAPGIVAVYQVGGVGTPGISDIDIYAIFEDDISCPFDPLEQLGRDDRYLFIHGQFGACRRAFSSLYRYGFFHDYRLLWGEELSPAVADHSHADLDMIQSQAGLEYLVKAWISLSVERSYGIIRIRNLLLVTKALLYDFEYLGLHEGALVDLVRRLVTWREAWFDRRPATAEIKDWIETFHSALQSWLGETLQRKPLCIPGWAGLRIAANMVLEPGHALESIHRGMTLPPCFGGLGRRYFNVQHRFNSFCFRLPIRSQDIPRVLLERHEAVAEALDYNHRYLQHFAPVALPLAIFNRSGR